jgi:hypothetical protein
MLLGDSLLKNRQLRLYKLSPGKLVTILNLSSWYNGFWTWQLGWLRELRAFELDQVSSLKGLLNEIQLFQWKPNAKI